MIDPVSSAAAPGSAGPTRTQRALFQPIGDEGRATLVERRIAEAILGGVLRAGDRLPSELELGRTLGVAPVTVREALQSLRSRGLVVTRRGRGGGSFVAATADPIRYAERALAATSRLALRDMLVHYGTVTAGCIRLAAERADPREARQLAIRLKRADAADLAGWRHLFDDLQIELAALSQSARLTREQIRLQLELSPYLALLDTDPEWRSTSYQLMSALIETIADDRPADAPEAFERMLDATAQVLIERQSVLSRSARRAVEPAAGSSDVSSSPEEER